MLCYNSNVNVLTLTIFCYLNCRPSFAAAWMNLGIVQASMKKYNEALISYTNAIRHRHNYPDCFYNLGNLVINKFSFLKFFIILSFYFLRITIIIIVVYNTFQLIHSSAFFKNILKQP